VLGGGERVLSGETEKKKTSNKCEKTEGTKPNGAKEKCGVIGPQDRWDGKGGSSSSSNKEFDTDCKESQNEGGIRVEKRGSRDPWALGLGAKGETIGDVP